MTPRKGFGPVLDWFARHLHRKFLAILIVILLTVSLVFMAVLVGIYQQSLEREHVRASLQVNRLLQASLENSMLKRDLDGLRTVVARLGQHEEIAGVSILNPGLEVRFSSQDDKVGTTLADAVIRTALKQRTPQTDVVSAPDGDQWTRSIIPVRNRAPCVTCHGAIADNPVNGLLVVDYKSAGLRTAARNTALLLAGIGGLVILLMGTAVWWAMQRLVAGRLSVLNDASLRLAGGNLRARAQVSGADEIGGLARSFNDMADELSASLDKVNSAEHFLQAVIDAIPDGVRVIDDDFNIVKANGAYCAQLGQDPQNVIGAKCYASSHARSEPCPHTLVTCPVVELRKAATDRLKASHKHVRADGADLFVEVTAARAELPAQGTLVPCVVESIRDLAEQVKYSHEQRLSEIGLLATGVAHEIHNPLSSIELALSSLREDLDDPGKAGANLEYLGIARNEITKCLEVTDGLMRLSEPPRDLRGLVRLRKLIPEVVSLLSYQMKQAGIAANLDLSEGLRVVAADSDMRMIVINLAQNALHAMPDSGTLTITGRRVGANIELVFEDTGIGIPESHIDKIFLPFWSHRADTSTGRGLGLSICRAIIERYGGTIAVQSTVGVGTTFTVRLPSADKEASEDER